MKKVTCIVGSARNNGSCSYLIDAFVKGIGGAGVPAQLKTFFNIISGIWESKRLKEYPFAGLIN